MLKKISAVVLGGLMVTALAACGGDNGAAEANRTTARSPWASPRSAPRAAGAPPTPSPSRSRPRRPGSSCKFSDAQQKQENQIKAIRSYIAQKVDVIAFSPVVESGWDTVLKEAKDAKIPVILTDRAVDSKDTSLYKTFIGSDFVLEGKKAGEWLVKEYARASRPGEHRRAAGHHRLGAGQRPQGGLRRRHQGRPEVQGRRLADRRLHPGQGQGGHGGLPEGQPQDIDVLYAHNDDMGLGAIEAIEAAGKKPGVDIKIVTVDAVKDGMTALADGQDQLHRRVQPAARPTADGPGQEGRRRRDGPAAGADRGDHVHPGAGQGRSAGPQVLSADRRAPARPRGPRRPPRRGHADSEPCSR